MKFRLTIACLLLAVLGCASANHAQDGEDRESVATTAQALVPSPIMGTLGFNSATDKLVETWNIADGSLIGGWRLSSADTILKDRVADFDGDGFDDVIVRSGWGIGVLGTVPAGWTTKAMNAFGTSIGNGWTLEVEDQVVAVGAFANASGAAMMILRNKELRPGASPKGMAFVKIGSGGNLQAVSVIAINGTITGSGQSWPVKYGERLFNVGKVNGTTDAIVALNETDGMSVYLPSATGAPTLIARVPNRTAWTANGLTYTLLSEDARVRAYGGDFDRAADGRSELVLSGPSGLAIFHLNTSTNILGAGAWDRRFQLPDGQPFGGTSVKGTMHSLIKVANFHSTSASNADMLFQTETGLALIGNPVTTSVPWTFSQVASRSYGSTISPAWSLNGNDLIPPYVGDVTGDGFLDFVLTSATNLGLGYRSSTSFLSHGKTALTALPLTDPDQVVGIGKFGPTTNTYSLFYKKVTTVTPTKPAVLTYNNDNYRTGVQPKETVFTPSAISSLGLVPAYADLPVHAPVHAQVLYVPDVNVAGIGLKDLAVVVSENHRLYQFDAANGQLVTPTPQFGDPEDSTARPILDGLYTTPVVDYDKKIMYLVVPTRNAAPTMRPFWLMAWDLQRQKLVRWVHITGSVPKSDTSQETFSELNQAHRPALLLHKGSIYVGFGAIGARELAPDYRYHGWLFRYDAESFEFRGVFNSTPNDGPYDGPPNGKGATGAGIWQGGGGVTADDAGNIYVSTGNGADDELKSSYGDSMVRLSPRGFSLQFRGRIGADDPARSLQKYDWDFGGAGVVAIPGTTRIIGGGKDGRWFVADSSQFDLSHTQVFQAYTNLYDMSWRSHASWDQGPHIHGQPIFWNNYLYHQGELDVLKAWAYNPVSGQLSTTPVISSDGRTSPMGQFMHNREALSVNGSTTSSGVLWIRQELQDEDGTTGCEGADVDAMGKSVIRPYVSRLAAYEAVPQGGQLRCLASASMPDFGKGVPPTIAGGKVFVPTNTPGDGASWFIRVLKLGTGATGFPDCALVASTRPNCMGLVFKGVHARAVTTTGDWAPGSYKAECPANQGGRGLSLDKTNLQARSLYCGREIDSHFSHSTCRAVGISNTSTWDPGALAGECNAGEYVAGVAQNMTSGALTSILCCTGNAMAKTACTALTMSASDVFEDPTRPNQDWDIGNGDSAVSSLAECRVGRYLAGVSRTSSGTGRKILCCTP